MMTQQWKPGTDDKTNYADLEPMHNLLRSYELTIGFLNKRVSDRDARIADLETQLAAVPVEAIRESLAFYMDIGDYDEHTDKIFAWLDNQEVQP